MGQLCRIGEFDRPVFGQCLAAQQRAQIRVPAAAGAEERGADREMLDVLERDCLNHQLSP